MVPTEISGAAILGYIRRDIVGLFIPTTALAKIDRSAEGKSNDQLSINARRVLTKTRIVWQISSADIFSKAENRRYE